MADTTGTAQLPADVAAVYELKGYKPGVILFHGIGEVDLTSVTLAMAEKINKVRPNILVKKSEAQKPKP
jgi:hypothetical protein